MTTPVPPRQNPDEIWRSEGAPPPPPPRRKRTGGGWVSMVLTAVVVFLLVDTLLNIFGSGGSTNVTYTEFSKQLSAGQVDRKSVV